jgi:hypothetical protein
MRAVHPRRFRRVWCPGGADETREIIQVEPLRRDVRLNAGFCRSSMDTSPAMSLSPMRPCMSLRRRRGHAFSKPLIS